RREVGQAQLRGPPAPLFRAPREAARASAPARLVGRRNAPAPGARLPPASLLDELLEALEVALGARGHHAEEVADVLDDALGLVVDLQGHPRRVVAQTVEGDHARVARARGAGPGDALVGDLLGDARSPLERLAAHLGAPAQVALVELRDRLDALHERREHLELGPLIVGGARRNVDVDRLHDRGHALLLRREAAASQGLGGEESTRRASGRRSARLRAGARGGLCTRGAMRTARLLRWRRSERPWTTQRHCSRSCSASSPSTRGFCCSCGSSQGSTSSAVSRLSTSSPCCSSRRRSHPSSPARTIRCSPGWSQPPRWWRPPRSSAGSRTARAEPSACSRATRCRSCATATWTRKPAIATA